MDDWDADGLLEGKSSLVSGFFVDSACWDLFTALWNMLRVGDGRVRKPENFGRDCEGRNTVTGSCKMALKRKGRPKCMQKGRTPATKTTEGV